MVKNLKLKAEGAFDNVLSYQEAREPKKVQMYTWGLFVEKITEKK